MAELNLTPEQQAVVENRGGALLVSAAAGAGKSSVLVERLFRRVTGPEQRDLDEFLIITYTNAAAAELRGKIAAELNRRLKNTPDDRHLQRQSVLVYKAQISTIHNFCAALLRENAHLLGLTPDFRIADEDESGGLLAAALDELLEARYEDMSEDFRSLVDTLGVGRDDRRLADVVLEAWKKLRSHPDPELSGGRFVAMLLAAERLPPEQTAWGRALLAEVAGAAAFWAGQMEDAAAGMLDYPALADAYGTRFLDDAARLRALAAAAGRGWDETFALLPLSFGRLGSLRNFEPQQLQEDAKTLRDLCKNAAKGWGKLIGCTGADAAEDIAAILPAMRELVALTQELDRRYAERKRGRSVVDFGDLEHLALQILTVDGAPTGLARTVSQRYCEVMVDEYQDTNEVQNTLITAVSRDGQNLFLVGDVKQSIYRFNLADPTIFLDKYLRYADAAAAGEGQPRKLLLSRNFRSRPQITDCVNFVFANLMSQKFGELDYGPSERLTAAGRFPAADWPAELDIIDLAEREEDDDAGRVEAEARHVARRVRELLRGAPCVSDGDGLRRAEPGDIVILMRSPRGAAARYTAALQAVGVDAVADGGGLLETQEVSVLLSLLEIIDNPHRDIPLAAVLRSPLWGFDDDTLARVRAASRDTDFYDALVLAAEEDARLRDFLDTLAELRLLSRDLSAEELLRLVIARTSALELFGAMPGGAGRKRNLLLLTEHARRYESRGYRGLFGFVRWFTDTMARQRGLNRAAGAAHGAVRIMSIHKSKGLEFPIVILADTTKRFNLEDLNRQVLVHARLGMASSRLDTERMLRYPTVPRTAIARRLRAETLSEELRLLYVAMTRAKDRLILTACVADAERTLSRLRVHRHSPVLPESMDTLGSMGEWLLLAGLLEGAERVLTIRRVGAAAEAAERGPEPAAGAGTVAPPALLAELDRKLNWTYPHRAAADIPSKRTATELKGRLLDPELLDAAPRPDTPERRHVRPRFAREGGGLSPTERGNALHLAMQYIRYERCAELSGVADELERLVAGGWLSRQQADAVEPTRILRLFRSPLGHELLTAQRAVREFKFSLLVPARELGAGESEDPVLLQGVIDCWLEEPDGLTVIDFKTDRVNAATVAARTAGYAPQLRAYAMALERMTGRPVKRRILYYFAVDRAEFV